MGPFIPYRQYEETSSIGVVGVKLDHIEPF